MLSDSLSGPSKEMKVWITELKNSEQKHQQHNAVLIHLSLWVSLRINSTSFKSILPSGFLDKSGDTPISDSTQHKENKNQYR